MDHLKELIEYCDTFDIILDIQVNGKEKSMEVSLRTGYKSGDLALNRIFLGYDKIKMEVADLLDEFSKVIEDQANEGGMFE